MLKQSGFGKDIGWIWHVKIQAIKGKYAQITVIKPKYSQI